MMTPTEFIDKLYPARLREPTDHICVSQSITTKDGGAAWLNCRETDESFQRWASRSDRAEAAWYISVATVDGTTNDRGRLRRGRRHLTAVWLLVLDDIGTKAQPPQLEPTYKLETSEGNYQWGYALDPTDDFETYERLHAWCAERGWSDAGAGGAYRVVRIPGSANVKPGRGGFRSRLTAFDPDASWSLEELVEALGADLSNIERQTPTVSAARQHSDGVSGVTDGVSDGVSGVSDPVLEWLAARGDVVEDNGGEWVTIRCPQAFRHTTPADTAGYSPLGRGGDGWHDKRAFKCLHAHCKSLKTKEFLSYVAENGGPECSGFDPLPAAQARYIFVQRGSQICDRQRRLAGAGVRSLQALADWSNANHVRVPTGGRGQPPLLRSVFLESDATKKVYDAGFMPGLTDQETFYDAEQGGELLNLYVPPRWPETDPADEPSLFLDHVSMLLPDDGERELFLDWLAWKVQNPARRPYAVLMVTDGSQGIGRSVVARFLDKMMPRKVAPATLGHLLGKPPAGDATYNDWATSETQFVVVEESKQTLDPDAFYRGYEHFKEVVDAAPRSTSVNRKFGAKTMEKLYFAVLMFSNHLDALHIPEEDRRVCVLRNTDEKRAAEDYQRLWDELYDPRGREHIRLWWWLRRRDVAACSFAYSPMTPAKRRMLGAAATTQDDWFADLAEDWSGGETPDDGAARDRMSITRSELEDFARRWYRENGIRHDPPPREIERVWRSLPDPVEKNGGGRVRVRIRGVRMRLKHVK